MILQEVKLPLNGTSGVIKGSVNSIILMIELGQLCLKVNCVSIIPFRFRHNFVCPINETRETHSPRRGLSLFLYTNRSLRSLPLPCAIMRALLLTSEHEVRAGLYYLRSAYLCAIVNTITVCNDAIKCIDLLRDPMYN